MPSHIFTCASRGDGSLSKPSIALWLPRYGGGESWQPAALKLRSAPMMSLGRWFSSRCETCRAPRKLTLASSRNIAPPQKCVCVCVHRLSVGVGPARDCPDIAEPSAEAVRGVAQTKPCWRSMSPNNAQGPPAPQCKRTRLPVSFGQTASAALRSRRVNGRVPREAALCALRHAEAEEDPVMLRARTDGERQCQAEAASHRASAWQRASRGAEGVVRRGVRPVYSERGCGQCVYADWRAAVPSWTSRSAVARRRLDEAWGAVLGVGGLGRRIGRRETPNLGRDRLARTTGHARWGARESALIGQSLYV